VGKGHPPHTPPQTTAVFGSVPGTIWLHSEAAPQLGEDLIRVRDNVRLLGVTVAADRSLDKHVSSVCNVLFLASSAETSLSLIRHRVAEDTSSRLCYIARGLLQLSLHGLIAEDDH